MKKLIVKNKFYFVCLSIFILAVGVLIAFLDKGEAILFINSNHTLWADNFFKNATRLGEEPVYVIVVLMFLAYRMRWSLLVALTGFAVMGVSYASKLFFAEDRPLAYFRKLNQDGVLNFVDGVKVYTGQTSFPSGHSMSAFALYTLLVFLLPPRKRYAGILFFLALSVVTSRIYLVQHFLRDIYAGSITGIGIAILVYLISSRIEYKPGHGLDRPLYFRKRKTA